MPHEDQQNNQLTNQETQSNDLFYKLMQGRTKKIITLDEYYQLTTTQLPISRERLNRKRPISKSAALIRSHQSLLAILQNTVYRIVRAEYR